MAVIALLVLFLAMIDHSSATWCVCRSDVSDTTLQKTLDYACGAGADCTPISQNGACYQPNTVRAHCSYAVNSYFQKKGQATGTCDFASTASATATDPSTGGTCVYPTSASSTGNNTTPTISPPTTPTTTTPPSNTTPSTTPSTGVLGGGIGNGLGPTGTVISTDSGSDRFIHQKNLFSVLLTPLFSGSVLLWG
ncbi:hypothetical protein HHK36_024230 [Tetracentron sinense]|uniref:X8 domain-containing protein n=1 Tax=Tetracentron sinense TaxID=13715 RepID=A0A834YMF2_TETSI|nr:hypothetical protein HHK36_024230 [Tetracentron sinense]